MPKELQPVTDAIGSIFDSPLVQLGLRAIAVYWIIFWLAAAYWAFRDLQLRTDNPVMPYLAAAFVILFTPLVFPAAIVIYRVVRPHEKIDEVYERTLAEEAMLAEIEKVRHCPTCRRRIDDEWIICPTCRTRLARVCPNCSRLVGLDWSLCAWCGRDFERRDVVAATVSRAPAPAVSAPGPATTTAPIASSSIATPTAASLAAPLSVPTTAPLVGPMAAPMASPRATAGAPARASGASPRSPSRARPPSAGARPSPNRAAGRPASGSLPES